MSYLKNGIKLAALVYLYKLIDDDSKIAIKSVVKDKITKYKPKLMELIDLINSFDEGFQNLRSEESEFKKNFNLFVESLDSINKEEIQKDVDEVADIVTTIMSSKSKKKIITSKNTKKSVPCIIWLILKLKLFETEPDDFMILIDRKSENSR